MPVDVAIEKGWALQRQGKLAEAEQIYRQILTRDPNQPDALQMLGQIAFAAGRAQAAIQLTKRSLNIAPDQPEVRINLGIAYADLRNVEKAIQCYEEVIKKHPDMLEAYRYLGAAQMMQNGMDKAGRSFRHAISLAPEDAELYRLLSMCERFSADDPLVGEMESKSNKKDASFHIHYALANHYRKTGDNIAHIKSVLEANRLQHATIKTGMDRVTRRFQSHSNAFSGKNLPNQDHPTAAFTPIFIVGTPRAGSTLVEQILASHSGVFGGDELTSFRYLIPAAAQPVTGQPFPVGVEALGDDPKAQLGEIYLKAVGAMAPNARFITDKYPGNFQFIGVIRHILPHARIIDIRREPMAAGLSVLQNYFPGATPFLCDQEDFGLYYNAYVEQMNHWDNLFPDWILRVNYEDIIENQEGETRRILDFCGLVWEEACLEFYRSERVVMTNSVAQVRKPVYRSSIAAWKQFAKELQPLSRSLARSLGRAEHKE